MIQFPTLLKRIAKLIRHPIFLSLAAIGNGIILLGASTLYFLESGTNSKIHSFLDPLWWAVATVTTVGYGDVSPVTIAGKCLGIVMMLIGTTLFCSFTALFAATLLSGPLEEVEQDVRKLERELHSDEQQLDHHLQQIELLLDKMKTIRKRKGPQH